MTTERYCLACKAMVRAEPTANCRTCRAPFRPVDVNESDDPRVSVPVANENHAPEDRRGSRPQ